MTTALDTRYVYLGRKPRTDDHVGAVPDFRRLACRAQARGAVGDCTRARDHAGYHQNGASADAWVDELELPVHQLPESCHVCGQHARTADGRPACAHDLTNAEADAAAREHDARTTVRYSSGATTPDAAYVAEHVPDAYVAAEVAAGRACGQHDRPRPCPECQ